MQTRRLIIFMVIGMALVFGWQWFLGYMYETHPEWKRPGQNQQVAATQPEESEPSEGAATTEATSPATTQMANGQAPALTGNGQPGGAKGGQLHVVDSAAQPYVFSIGSADRNDERFRMGLTLTNQGAGIEKTTLNAFTQTEKSNEPYSFQEPIKFQDQTFIPLATRSISIDGRQIDLSGVMWNVESQSDPNVAAFYVDIARDGEPLVRVRKVYQLSARSDGGDMGYEVAITEQLQNLSESELKVRTTVNGPVTPGQELDTQDDRQVIAGYAADERVRVASHHLNAFSAGEPKLDLTHEKDKTDPIVWFGASSVYFDAIVRPIPLEKGAAVANYVASVQSRVLNPSDKPEEHLVATSFTTSEFTLAPAGTDGAEQLVPLRAFFGPKMRSVLESDYYGAYPIRYDQTLSTLNSGCYSYCAVGPLISVLVWLLRGFEFIFHDWGLAIIGLVVVVRLALHPITKKSQVNMAQMGKFGPEMERLKKKYGDNKEELNKAMMQFYKQHGFTPILGCLPMLLQMPIWVALWQALQNTFELRHASFLWGFTWIKDLSRPDQLFYFPDHGFSLIFLHINAINILPILMAVVFYLQQKFMPRAASVTKEQEQQQKMMQWMTLLFPLFLYNQPSGLNLYILTSTTIGIFESRRIRDLIRRREEAEKEGKVIVEARPTRGARQRAGTAATAEVKKGGIAGWLADLQEKADRVRRDNDKKKSGGSK